MYFITLVSTLYNLDNKYPLIAIVIVKRKLL